MENNEPSVVLYFRNKIEPMVCTEREYRGLCGLYDCRSNQRRKKYNKCRLDDYLHRLDGPAKEWSNGLFEWFKDGKLHRIDGPAQKLKDGSLHWMKNGKLHRLDGPALIIPDGTKVWFKHGKMHRKDGPAAENPHGFKIWSINGKKHREDGPAFEHPDGFNKWYIDNQQIKLLPKKILLKYMKANNYQLIHLLTDPDPIVRESAMKYKLSK